MYILCYSLSSFSELWSLNQAKEMRWGWTTGLPGEGPQELFREAIQWSRRVGGGAAYLWYPHSSLIRYLLWTAEDLLEEFCDRKGPSLEVPVAMSRSEALDTFITTIPLKFSFGGKSEQCRMYFHVSRWTFQKKISTLRASPES